MKQLYSISDLAFKIKNLTQGQGFSVKNFHPDLLKKFIQKFDKKVFITVEDSAFNSLFKHLGNLSDKEGLIFLSGEDFSKDTPRGFSVEGSSYHERAKEILAEGLENVRFIIGTQSGVLLPVVGSGIKNRLVIDKGVLFEDCCNFLKKELYNRVDFVTSNGEFAMRGGIIDVFLYSRDRPFRINFLDSTPLVFEFNVDTQLTQRKIPFLEMVSVAEKKPYSVTDADLSSFLSLNLSAASCLTVSKLGALSETFYYKTISHREFSNLLPAGLKKITIDDSFSSIGLIREMDVAVPGWFLEKEPSTNTSFDKIAPLALSDIMSGDYLVHRDHGVSKFIGLIQKRGGAHVQEFVVLEFADGAKILLDSARLDLISFYAPSSSENVALDSLSKKNYWNRKKSSAEAQAEETIASLLSLYVKRSEISRAVYVKEADIEKQFISSFPFKETPDQNRAWEEISKDLEGSSPMDRLLCGDVGFGKTELAIRAAFRVVMSQKRVVVLSPTTILASQLYSSFLERMEEYGIAIAIVSRLRSQKEALEIQSSIENGLNDVLIGTHAVLNKNIYMKNIGLVVIDEEHRFGVKHKERIKEFKVDVDVLSMSATPIPRSMNLAISKICSVSTLQTPPRFRLPIKTLVEHYNIDKIKGAIFFEINRGGQVYFVHNDTSSIKRVADQIASWLKGGVVEYIHGQEAARAIERKMMLFIDGKIDVLVCTTIIESGIDVSSANCIIINNSHLFGLSQLYQMRGRVGRGLKQAYAYLLVPRGISLSDKSFKRIKSIEKNTSLGSGYNISMADMEIRGSGSLFGYKQSGGSAALGYEMYTKMIQRALHDSGKLDSGFLVLPEDVVVKIYQHRYIPEDYISTESIRMSIYKNITNADSNVDLDNILYNLEDRFGPVPLAAKNLISESRLRLVAAKMGLSSIQKKNCGYIFSLLNRADHVYTKSFLDYTHGVFNAKGVEYHILPQTTSLLSVCVHLDKNEDIYTFFSRFLGKFESL